jgi:hypothetical protein
MEKNITLEVLTRDDDGSVEYVVCRDGSKVGTCTLLPDHHGRLSLIAWIGDGIVSISDEIEGVANGEIR